MQKNNSIAKHLFTFGGFTAISRLTGFVRDNLITHFLGKSVWYELFLIAYKSTNWMRRFFAEGALNVSLIPELVKHRDDPEKFHALAQNTFSLILYTLGFFVLLMEVTAPFFLPMLFGRYGQTEIQHLVFLFQLNFPYALLISLCAICNAVLNTHQKFYAESSLPIILNFSLIISIYAFRNYHPAITTAAMSYSVLIAGVIQITWLYFLCRKYSFSLKLRRPKLFSDETSLIVKKTGKNSLISFANQMNLFIDLYLATFLPVGAITYLSLADRLNQFPLSIIGVALSVVLLPNFSKYKNGSQEVKSLFHNSIIGSLQLSLPITFLMIALADPIFYVLFFHGKFTLADTINTAKTLKMYAFGIPFVILTKVLLSFLFSRSITRVPLYSAILSVVTNTIISVVLLPYVGHLGIAIGTSIAACLNCLCLVTYIYLEYPEMLEDYHDILAVIVWSITCGMVCYFIKINFLPKFYPSFLENSIFILLATGFFSGLYYGIGYKTGIVKFSKKN
ncbi:MAG: murein biosynthesis integral membrane protein MurJ [Alphaproteobacteria bacterium]|nr:MAG: murein biosynthesis integral membrane protein MurJ [Alphaproteobacteria bacterium]